MKECQDGDGFRFRKSLKYFNYQDINGAAVSEGGLLILSITKSGKSRHYEVVYLGDNFLCMYEIERNAAKKGDAIIIYNAKNIMKCYKASLTEHNGEYCYYTDILIKARNMRKAEEKLIHYAKNSYPFWDVHNKKNRYVEFNGGEIAVHYGIDYRTTEKEFMEILTRNFVL